MSDVDVMAFGGHPDDVEIGCGGTLIKLSDAGYSVVIVDMVRGELGTRGTVDTRDREAKASAKIIGAMARENLGLEDGNIHVSRESKRKVVEVIREYRPRLALLPYHEDRHPDHYHASQLAYEGIFLAGLSRYDTGQGSYRPPRVAYYAGWYEFDPTFIVDITAQFERKMEAIYAFSTQFQPGDTYYQQAGLTSRNYDKVIVGRMTHWGSAIGVEYGEGFLIRGVMRVENPLEVEFSSF